MTSTNNRRYRASVWVYDNGNTDAALQYKFKNGSTYIDGGEVKVSDASTVKAGDWYLLTIDIEIPDIYAGYELMVGAVCYGTAYYDDFRFHPLDAPMTSYVYDEETGQLRYILDGENFFTEYEYKDDLLYKVHRESTEVSSGKRIVSKHEINYKN